MKSLKKALILILSLLLVISALPFTAFAETTEVTDEPVNNSGWTAISTAEEFQKLLEGSTGNFYLANDIDFDNKNYDYIVKEFDGVLDGNGYAIYNFTLNSAAQYVGVFLQLGFKAATVVKDLKIGKDGAEIQAKLTSNTRDSRFGFLAARGGRNDCRLVLDNVDVYGKCDLNYGTTNTRSFIGGVLGDDVKSFQLTDVTFNGYIHDNTTHKFEGNIGGIIGRSALNRNSGKPIIKNCENNGELKDFSDAEATVRLGGIVGILQGSALIQDCKNNGNLESVTTSEKNSVQKGAVIGYARSTSETASSAVAYHIIVIKDCSTTNNSVTSLVGYADKLKESTKRPNLYISGSPKASENTTGVIGITNSNFDDVIAGLNSGTSTDYPLNGIYKLEEDIDLSSNGQNRVFNAVTVTVSDTESYKTASVITRDFAGIFDGNGHSISGFELNGSGETAFFFSVSNTTGNDSAIIDLTLGKADNKVQIYSTKGRVATLVATSGSSTYGPIVSGITVYSDIEMEIKSNNYIGVGMIAGKNSSGIYNDCKAYGSMKVTSTTIADDTDYTGYVYAGGIIGTNYGTGREYTISVTDCINCADINVTFTEKKLVGGIAGEVGRGSVYYNCANLGKIEVHGDTLNEAYASAGGILGQTNNDAAVRIVAVNCINFADVTADEGHKVGSFIGAAGYGIVLDGFKNLGKSPADTLANSNGDTDYALSTYDSGEGAVATMAKGASVRISEPTGIRFKAQCDPVVLGVIRRVADITITENDEPSEPDVEAPNITFGTIIAPKSFITGDFTKETKNYTVDEGVVPFVDVPSNGNFKNVDGQIAGSLVGIDSDMKDVLFVGRAYVSFTVNGTAFTFYAAMNDNERSVANVADAALADLLYVKDEKYYTYSDGAYTEYTGADKTAYTETVGDVNADGYTVVSPYDADERVLLGKLLAGTATN